MNEKILWMMNGKRQNDKIVWEAFPKVVKLKDNHKFFLYGGGGGSLKLIGKLYFESKEECEKNFLSKHDSLFEVIGFDEPTPDGIEELERTDFQDLEVCKWNTVDTTTVYAGNVDNLLNVTELLKWHEEECEPLCCTLETLTLSEIYEQAKELVDTRIFTVFVDEPLKGTIYQCGNYEDGKWVKYGSTRGYA